MIEKLWDIMRHNIILNDRIQVQSNYLFRYPLYQ